jgi:peptidylprolyl isomerase
MHASRRVRTAVLAFAAAAILGITIGASIPTVALAQSKVTTPSGLQIIDTAVGTGATPKAGQICVMHYTGWLYNNGVKGQKFDSSRDRNRPFEFPVGTGKVIRGWDEGVASMKVGGKRTLIIPASMAYGSAGAPPKIPANSGLVFDVELTNIQ